MCIYICIYIYIYIYIYIHIYIYTHTHTHTHKLLVHTNLKRQILSDICKIGKLQHMEFIEIARALSSDIYQATSIRSRLKTM